MKIKITESHIKAGVRKDTRYCPMALAIAESIPGSRVLIIEDIGDFSKYLYVVSINKQRHHIYFKKEADDFVRKFDDGEKVEPCEFETCGGFSIERL